MNNLGRALIPALAVAVGLVVASPVSAGQIDPALGVSPVAPCTIVGTPGDDRLVGTDTPDVICGLAGNDTLIGKGSGDVLRGGKGDDVLWGSAGHDVLFGGRGRDLLVGGADADALDGGRRGDECYESTGTATHCESGSFPATLRIVTDATWRYSFSHHAGWNEPAFNASHWNAVEAPSFGICDDLIPYWYFVGSPAVPIWGSEPAGTMYARKTFWLDSPAVATIQASADDDLTMYVNGVLVAAEADGRWGPLLEAEVALPAGQNVVAVKVVDTEGTCQTVILDMTVS